MNDEFLDITPHVHFLESIRADRGSWATLIAEGVDNSLDAGALQVAIQLFTDSVVIADDGRGISKDRESAIVRLGEHRPMPGTKLGRFGMGIKYNATSAGDLLEVDSTSSDGQMSLIVDWTKVIRSGRWHIPKPKWAPVFVARGTGTTIKVSRLRWDAPKEKVIIDVREHLAQIFYPAIEQGITIRFNGSDIRLLREPELSDVVEQTIQLPNGKGAHVRGGLLVSPEKSSLYGVQVSYKHRVIIPKGIFGCNSYSGLRQMFARVTLTSDWGLTRFKDNLNDPDAAQLEDAVQEALKPVLEKCHSAQLEVKVEELTELLNKRLPPEMRASRPSRNKGKVQAKQGKKQRKNNGESEGQESPNGPTKSPRSQLTTTIVFDGPLCQEHGYGMYTKGRPNRITLARDNPDIAALLEQRDTQLAIRCLFGFALMIYQHALETDPGQKQLPFDQLSSFGLRVWNIAAQQTVNAAWGT